ncbi:acetyltransferase (GNAT) family protein [Paenibacillus cellulosilyticus]|uniref:Acetyltransferase (GNAT) family protein n=1 Tax=Paenibacillus cellulosilyticus TaxID=375489 RepID=A0A2V2YUB7_9BACL|nr:GNAT family N-acetyltransferase [Paenibacillus cellulosilyticus]PWW02857.1 acetyltransferase (GNAT) family protein [Paenibacillus cellulosilyticus]QKS45773.1 GNAT family N-acetyltransferase [Paenibacillus cellulosilyticus]
MINTLTIRQAGYQDAAVLEVLLEELGGHPISTDEVHNRLALVERSDIDSIYLCCEGEDVLGLLSFRIRHNMEEVSKFGEISGIVVRPEARRKGVGKALMAFAEELAEREGCIGTWLVSGFGREEEAHHFYKELGYQITGYRFVKRTEAGE